jgi:subtilisin family serine protease
MAALQGDEDIRESSHFLATYHGDPQVVHASVISFGGSVDFIWPGIGVARLSGLSDRQAERLEHIPGIDLVLRDLSIRWVHALTTDGDYRVQASPDVLKRLGGSMPPEFFDTQWALERIEAPEAWKITRGSSRVRVGVLDTGISPDHIDLAGLYDLSRSRNLSESNRADQNDYFDRHHHGTLVSALIASNGLGIAGVASSTTLVGVKVLDDNGEATFANIIAGIMYAVDDARIDIINLSLGGSAPGEHVQQLGSILQRAVDYAVRQGVLVIASAGNDGIDLHSRSLMISSPDDGRGALFVSATTEDDDLLACYSNYGSNCIAIAAPGGAGNCDGDEADRDEMVLSALAPAVARRLGLARPDSWYMYASGTSMATPLVTGVAALIKSVHPSASPAVITRMLLGSAKDIGASGRDRYFGGGLVNAARALR